MTGFGGEYLRELHMASKQLLALAEAFPDDAYDWRPAEGTRSFGGVLVHVGTANFGLLHLTGAVVPEAVELYGEVEGREPAQLMDMLRKNISLERSVSGKGKIVDFLRRSFEAVEQSFTAASPEALEESKPFPGETATVRRLYLRILVHAHEHMGQAVAYTRAKGLPCPWPDPVKNLDCAAAA